MANQEQLEMLKQGVEVWNKQKIRYWLLSIDLTGANLQGANLRRADLREADLREADLRGADLQGANLRRADLRGANLRVAILRNADLRGADLREADLQIANLSGADLRGANLQGASLMGADFKYAIVWDTDLRAVDLRKVDFREADLRDATFVGRIRSLIFPSFGRLLAPGLQALKAVASQPPDEVFFTAFYPKEGEVETWHTLLVYAHLMSAVEAVLRDVQRFDDQIPVPKKISSSSPTPIQRGAEITIVPSCDGIVFNPERFVFKWLEEQHRAEFRFRVDKSLSNDVARGQINIYVGPLMVGTQKFAMLIDEIDPQSAYKQEEHSRMYHQQDIFVSYSHKDTAVVLACKKAYEALGFNVLIDIDTLRSGQVWNEELMRMIDRATIFQIFWSQNSSQSIYCRQEWEHALKRNREGFIRPVYWEIPMPDPPEELSRYHFEYMQP